MGLHDQVSHPFEERLPPPGEAIEAAPGVWWLRMPLPFALDHINLWALEDGDGWTLVDSGIGSEATRELWQAQLVHLLAGRPVKNVIVTHYHPDHMGNAAWLVERTGAELHMTTGEFLSAHAAHADLGGFDRANTLALFVKNGLDAATIPEGARQGNFYARSVPTLPRRYRRLMDGDRIAIGGHEWQVITVFGHAPEHAALWCESLGVLISGDQVLPRITTNVGVWGNQPEANPLKLFLDSLGSFAHLPEDTLVLPSHDRVFRGLHARIAQLHEHHRVRLDRLAEAAAQPITAFEALPLLFKRKLDEHQMGFAMGEAIAHLHYLEEAGRVRRVRDGAVDRYLA